MNIVFMGTPAFSVPILEALNERYTIKMVVTQPDKPVGRKKVLTPPPVKKKALELGLKVFQPQKIKAETDVILNEKPDLIITAAYGQILPKVLLETPPLKAINVHGSLLPKLRGGAPIQRAIEHQHQETGVTIMYMHQKMDAGDIISQQCLKLKGDETSGELFETLSQLGKTLLLKTLPDLIEGHLQAIPQNKEEVTYAYNIKREEERLDFNQTVASLDAKIRAFHPAPNTYTTLKGKKLKVIKARIHQCPNFMKNHSNQPAGTIIKFFEDGIAVKASDGALVLTEVQLEGKKAMPAATFMHGAGKNLLTKGDQLGQ